jgi:putative heme-binding domain-containing protein
MHFPKDAVLVRTLSLGDRRVETQLLHYDGLDWRAYSYAWRDDQSDADLVPADGAEKELPGLNAGSGPRVWQFQSRAQCMSCHSNQSEYALGFAVEQLNRPGQGGRNQLVAFTESGLIRRAGNNSGFLPPFDDAGAARERKVADPLDETLSIETRARGYLHANCGHCHSDHGGGAVALRLPYFVPAAEMKAIGVRPARGDFGLPDPYIIKPGDPYASTLFFRMAKFGRDRMPHIGSELPDETGLKLIEQWIAGMSDGDRASESHPTVRDANALTDPKAALVAARHLARGDLQPAEREALLAEATKLPAGFIRDLFEGYLPVPEKAERKLGSSPRPKSIMSLKGDAARGEALFWSQAVDCGKCHRVGDRGAPVGPELTAIGQQRSAEDLLESLLYPSRRIEPKYAAYLASTTDGRSITGVLVSRDDKTLLLRDAQGKDIHLAAKEIDQLRPGRNSLMPEGQMAGLTAQQAADLLAFLTSRKGNSTAAAR